MPSMCVDYLYNYLKFKGAEKSDKLFIEFIQNPELKMDDFKIITKYFKII